MRHDAPLLVFEDVTLSYGREPVLQGLTFHVCAGELLGIVGPNGTGKSTILRAILGLLRPRRGVVRWRKRPIIGYVPQREHIDSIIPVTAGEVALMGRAARMSPLQRVSHADRSAAAAALERVGVETLEPRLFRDLSGGQQQRVLIARALAAEPDVLVLDEPTNGMDLASETSIVELLKGLNRERGLTVVLVTHSLNIVLDTASTILLLEGGRHLYGDADEVLREDRLSALYGLPVRLVTARSRRTLVVERR